MFGSGNSEQLYRFIISREVLDSVSECVKASVSTDSRQQALSNLTLWLIYKI